MLCVQYSQNAEQGTSYRHDQSDDNKLSILIIISLFGSPEVKSRHKEKLNEHGVNE